MGGPTCVVIASKVPHVQITVADIDARRIAAWNSDELPIFEPELAELTKPARDGSEGREANLHFTTDVEAAIAAADLVFVSVNTPTKLQGRGAGSASDLGYIEAATRMSAKASTSDKVIVEKSTVPVATAKAMRDILTANARPGVHFDVLSNPEFLAEGTAITYSLFPDRVLIGSFPRDESGMGSMEAVVDLYANWVPRERSITMSLWSSELAKLAANAFLAQRISSINSLSAICEAAGADIDEVAFACGLDKRIGPHMLKSSVGFGGSCFKKDVLNLAYLADTMNLPEVGAYWKSVVEINEWQKDRFVQRIINSLYGTLSNKRMAIFGFAHKKKTGDTRESAAISITNTLISERANIAIYDPQVREEQIWRDLGQGAEKNVTVAKDSYEACRGAHAVVILTEWDEFKLVYNQEHSTHESGLTGQQNRLNDLETVDKLICDNAKTYHRPSAAPQKACVDWNHV